MLKRLISSVLCVMLALTATTVQFAVSESCFAEAAADYTTPYYYSQLSDNAKTIYTKLKKAVLECKTEVKIENASITEKEFRMLTELLLMYDPMTFNLYNFKLTTTTYSSRTSKRVVLNFTLEYIYDKTTYDKMVSAYEKKADNILSRLNDDMSAYQKLRVIHDEIIESTDYDLESSSNGTIYGALVKNKAKCDGYANAFNYICSKAGIRVINVLGYAEYGEKSEYHMWNKVYYNKKWYNVDVTWDDPESIIKNNITHDYFMISDAAISKSHSEEKLSFDIPAASDDSINYYKVNKKYADSLSSAKNLISGGIVSAAKNNTAYYEFQCSSKSVFDQVQKYIKDTEKISSVLKNAKSKTGKKLAASIYSHMVNEDQYTVKILLYYEGTSLEDYYTDTSFIDSDTLKSFANAGIK